MTNEQVLSIIAFAMVVNAILIAIALLRIRSSRSRGADDGGRDQPYASDLVPAMAAAAAGGYGALRSGRPDEIEIEPIRMAGEAGTGGATATDDLDPVAAGDLPEVGAVEVGAVGSAIDVADPAPGLLSPTAWRREVEQEAVRLARYQRPATVMFIELDGYDRLVGRLGEPAGQRLVVATAGTLRSQSRSADRCARVGRGRFAVLLPETDEISAINFAERVRDECDRWLEAGEVAMRVAIGWALLDAVGGASAAIEEAERRLDGERRHRASAGGAA